jgi:hypothetical protein
VLHDDGGGCGGGGSRDDDTIFREHKMAVLKSKCH